MYAIDLFCGAGGFSEGILQAGFHIVYSSDKSSHVQETYEARHNELGLIHNFNTYFNRADIRELTGGDILNSINSLPFFKERNQTFNIGDIDAIFGGPPCQGFSIAGKRDKSDPRNMLFREYLRVIKELQPKYIVMENVSGFMSMQVNPDFKSFNNILYSDVELVKVVVQEELKAFGYEVLEPRILDASDYGVPQRRQRVIFLAHRKDVSPVDYPQPTTPNNKITVEEALAGLSIDGMSQYSLDSKNGRTPHFITKNPLPAVTANNLVESNHSKVITERFSLFNEGESVANLKNRLLIKLKNNEVAVDLNQLIHLKLETLFNINKDYNKNLIKKEFEKLNVSLNDKELSSVYKVLQKTMAIGVHNKDETKYTLNLSKKFGLDFYSTQQLISDIRSNMNKLVTADSIHSFFKGEIPITEKENGLFTTLNEQLIAVDTLFNALLTNKNTRSRLALKRPSPTMITLPDDFIHPVQEKMLNVREMARLQSFDDSFIFHGKRTTGGNKRKDEVPQFTQVGNAVPPLLGFAIANEVKKSIILSGEKEKVLKFK